MEINVYSDAQSFSNDFQEAVPDFNIELERLEKHFDGIDKRNQILIVVPEWKGYELGSRVLVGRYERESEKAVMFRSLNIYDNRYNNHPDYRNEWIPKSIIEYAATGDSRPAQN